MKIFIGGLLLIASSNPAVANGSGDPAAGKSMTILCIGCHGADGNNSNPVYPKLAGQGSAYLAKQLADFKTGARKEEHMTSMVEAIGLADIPNIAAWFASQKRLWDVADKAKTDAGRQIYQNGIEAKNISACAGCHGPKGMGTPAAKFPALAGQHVEYISKALRDFRSGMRTNDPQKMMRDIAGGLSDEEIASVSTYIGGMGNQVGLGH